MSIKDKIASILFGPKPEEEDAAQALGTEREQPEERTLENPSFAAEDPALIELPGEHPLPQLHGLRRREAGHLPASRICMDEEGTLPEDLIRREKGRLQAALKNACNLRLKSMKGNGNRYQKEKKDGEEDERGLQGLDALPWFFISSDRLYAWVMVFSPTGKGRELTREALCQAMKDQGITYGVNERLADRLAHNGQRYFNLFLIAQGKPAFDGKNGNIVDHFPRVVERVLTVDEYDQVDYTALNLIHNVKEGQEICRLIRPTEGEPGRTVLDQEIPAKSGKSVSLPKGRNTEISEDGDALVALADGHVEFTGRSFQVKPVLEIPGNVDFSTGNIKFLGDVSIKGDVLSGFAVRAIGSVWVGGVIEAGSTVEAGGDLTVVKGVLGDGSTTVRAQRCVFSKYVENATIYVRENLQTDAIINGGIYCDGEVLVRSGRGVIMGGRVWAAKKVSATTVGSKSERRTSIVLEGAALYQLRTGAGAAGAEEAGNGAGTPGVSAGQPGKSQPAQQCPHEAVHHGAPAPAAGGGPSGGQEDAGQQSGRGTAGVRSGLRRDGDPVWGGNDPPSAGGTAVRGNNDLWRDRCDVALPSSGLV